METDESLAQPVTVRIGDESYTFDAGRVSALDAWELMTAVGVDVVDVLVEFGRCVEAGESPPFHLLTVGKWLAVRQSGYPVLPFAGVAASTFVPGEVV